MDAWWTAQQAGMFGAIGGSGIGILGGLVGCMSVLVVRGKAKPMVVGLYVAMASIGLIFLVGGLVALVLGQPFHVWFPLALCGVIGSGVFGGLLPVVLARYKHAEIRRVEAEGLRRT